MNNKIYVGLDIGTNSVGYAVTDENYNIRKFRGEPAWGTVIFDKGHLGDERRGFRTSRRRLERRKQRVNLVQSIFAPEIAKVDERFFIRLNESALYRKDVDDEFSLFCDSDYDDIKYHGDYPTIHHLIYDLMNSKEPHDVRLVYLAVAWLIKHRGHFLSNIDVNNIDSLKNFKNVYDDFMNFFVDKGYEMPWDCEFDVSIGDILKDVKGVVKKNSLLKDKLYNGKKIPKETSETFPYSREGIVKLLAGGTYKLSDLFAKEEYKELASTSVSLKMDDDKLLEISSSIGDDYDLIVALRKVFDWSILVDVLGDYATISESKIAVYNQHKEDLNNLKYIIKKYKKDNYNEIFREDLKGEKGKYELYVKGGKKGIDVEEFSKYLSGVLEKTSVDAKDEELLSSIKERVSTKTFLPKQKNTDNRVIPHQLYQFELMNVLENACSYLDFLNDEVDGYSNKEKLEKIFTFKIPYYVGPLNSASEFAWMKRFPGADGKIYPWNFEEIVDLDKSESEFIRRMTNKCTYIPGEDVLPKCSLLYQKFIVLNELNNIRINGNKIGVGLKQSIYKDIFLKNNRVSKKKIIDFLISNNYINKGEEESVSGIDVNLNGTLSSWRAFDRILSRKILSEEDVERIIERSTYSEDKSRLKKWIMNEYPNLESSDVNYICSIRIKDFGRLSKGFLNGVEGAKKDTGEIYTVIGALWHTQDNLNEIILTDNYSFKDEIMDIRCSYYENNKKKLSDRLDDMYISNAVRRPIYRTFAILKDIEKAFGAPDKIFVEMARGGDEKNKGKRKDSRLEQIYKLYEKCHDEDVKDLKKQLEGMGEYANNKLQSDKLFLYYVQLGKCMYSGKDIDVEKLMSDDLSIYNIDHIYPQAYVPDDSIINNKVLCLSEINGDKGDVYPIKSSIRQKMTPFWKYLKDVNLISETKYKRLIRATPFTDDEKLGFINRQYVETTQATKAVATIINEKYPEAEIVYCKARLTSDFRKEFELWKSRCFNDLHHAVDAYLNVVTGNVYNMRFTKKWFNINQKYSVNPKTIFTHDVIVNNQVIWNDALRECVIKQAKKQNAHFVKYSYFKHGGLFDQKPVCKASGLVPRKKGLDTEKYGGYNKAGIMFYIPVKYKTGKKSTIIVMSVEIMYGNKFLQDSNYAKEYAIKRLESILGKHVDEVEFPMGMRPWKVNTVLSLDGYRVCITGIGGGGKCLSAQGITQFSDSQEWIYYLSKLEKYVEKITRNGKYIYDKKFDKVNRIDNMKLYNLYIQKYENTIYSKRINKPIEILKNGKEKFENLSINDQVVTLLNIHATFGRSATGGIDLKKIGGSGKSASMVNFSSIMSNWAKNYKDVRIVDISPAGIWEKQSDNLLELL